MSVAHCLRLKKEEEMLYVLFSNADLSFMVTVRQLRTSAIRFRIDVPAHSQQYWYESAYSNFLFTFYFLPSLSFAALSLSGSSACSYCPQSLSKLQTINTSIGLVRSVSNKTSNSKEKSQHYLSWFFIKFSKCGNVEMLNVSAVVIYVSNVCGVNKLVYN